ncbi:MAG: response regulator [Sporomusaceae bacterium]|jgi:CheY-like chemotaxis protein|nr:response regulator [Sporomusaceae bacterium]
MEELLSVTDDEQDLPQEVKSSYMHNVLIVTEDNKYLPLPIKEKLENSACKVSIVSSDLDEINAFKVSVKNTNLDVVLIYVDENLILHKKALIFLKDWIVMDDIPVVIMGDKEELNELKNIIPKHLIKMQFFRPLNVPALVETVYKFLKQASKEGKRKILVVDDSGPMLRNVKGWLGDKYNVSLVNSAAMAIKYLAAHTPDLILLDYEMPVVDGKQVLEMIRSEVDFADIPVIFLTHKEDRETILQVQALNPQGYLLKSMPPKLIVKAVDEFFAKKKAML